MSKNRFSLTRRTYVITLPPALLILSCCIALLCLFLFSPAYSQTAQEYFSRGLTLKQQGDSDAAIEELEKAVALDKNFARAYYELGLLYQSKGTPTSLKRAEEMFFEGMRADKDDVPYQKALALLFEDRVMYTNARMMWNDVLKQNPRDIDAFLGIARTYANEAERDRCRVDTVGEFDDRNLFEYKYIKYMVTDFSLPLMSMKDFYLGKIDRMDPVRWDEFITQKDSLAEEYNKKVLAIDPVNRDALFQLGLLYYNKVVYVNSFGEEVRPKTPSQEVEPKVNIPQKKPAYDIQSPETDFIGYKQDKEGLIKFAELFEELVERHPDDKDGQLFLGLAYHRLSDYEKAYEHYKTVYSLMSEKERAVFSDISLLRTGAFTDTAVYHPTKEEAAQFWYRNDPIYLTPYSERELEHYSRVAEAKLRFSVPRLGIEGWDTDQGKVWIKYGQPKFKRKWIINEPLDSAEIRRYLAAGIIPNTRNEFWSYDDFSFIFERGVSDQPNTYRFGIMGFLNFHEIVKDTEKEHPEHYEYKPKGKFIEFPILAAQFRGDAGNTRLEVYYGVPFNMIQFERENDMYYASFKTGMFIHNQNWEKVIGDIQETGFELKVSETDTSSDQVAVGKYKYQLLPPEKPSWYKFDFEMQDLQSENIGFFKDSLNIIRFGYDKFQMSDIVPAWNVTLIDSTVERTFDNINVEPNPRRFYRVDQPLYFYTEIYNLALNDTTSATDYTVEYSMIFKGKEDVSVLESLKRLVVNREPLQVGAKYTNRGSRRDEPLFLRIEHNLTQEGQYLLMLTVTDNNSKTTETQSVLIRIFNKNK